MLRDRRAWLIGGGAALALAAAGWLGFGPETAGSVASGARSASSRRAGGSEAPLPAAETVRLASLEQAREAPAGTTRNPFRFGARTAAPATSQPTEAMPTLTLKPVEPTTPTGPPPPPPIPLKFIGVVERADGTALAVLVPSQGSGAPLHGREGDIIDGRYRILKIGTESIELSYVDGRGRQTIRLTGQ